MSGKSKIKSNSKITEMNYLEYCRMGNIPVFPIRIDLIDSGKLLEDGTPKMKKNLLAYDIRKVTTNDFKKVKLCKKRWELFNNGNPHNYNAFASCTRENPIIDVDCILPDTLGDKPHPIKELLKTNPYKVSMSKPYGNHILVNHQSGSNTRTTIKLSKNLGTQPDGQAGVEFLDGLWEWSWLDDVIHFPHRSTQIPYTITYFLGNTPEVVEPPTINIAEIKPYDLEDIKYNLSKYKPEQLCDVQLWAGMVKACASSQDPDVYAIVKEISNIEGANWGGEHILKSAWGNYKITDTKYDDIFRKKYCKPRPKIKEPKEPKLPETWDEILGTNDYVYEKFMDKYEGIFLYQSNGKSGYRLHWYNEDACLWNNHHDSGRSKIYNLICTELRADLLKDWNERLEIESSKAIDEQQREQYAGHCKWVQKTGERLLTDSIVCGFRNVLYSKLTRTKSKDNNDIQFNLQPITTKYFQFSNGAFNLETGLLEKRTREMYITKTLSYEYSDLENKQEQFKIMNLFKQVLPDDKFLEGHLNWRGLCLTGEISPQVFVLNIGYTASNGKSTLSKIFDEAFPIYCKKLGTDCFDSDSSNAYNKCIASMNNEPIRLAYMEEWGEKKQSTSLIKSTTDGTSITCKPLYSEEINMKIQFKLEASSNSDPNMGGSKDNGIGRRCKVFHYTSQFVDDQSQVDHMKNIYIKDINVISMFDKDSYKLALFHILAPYAKKFYKDTELTLPVECSSNFKDIMNDADVWGEYMEQYEVCPGEWISKKDIEMEHSMYAQNNGKTSDFPDTRWCVIKQEFNKRGFHYNSQRVLTVGNTRTKGYMENIKFIGQIIDDTEPPPFPSNKNICSVDQLDL